MEPLISVVVCTYNRSSRLVNVIETLLGQNITIAEYEIIIVDNNSKDDTATVAQDLSSKHAHIRYEFQPQQGLSYARNLGWQVAKGKYVAYIDDDCKAHSDWLYKAKMIILDSSPSVFGGLIYPFYDIQKPAWFKDSYGTYSEGDEKKFLSNGEYLFGGNIFIRRDLFQKFGGFNTSLGMMGNKPGFGEETELVDRIRQSLGSASILYDPDLFVYHLVDPQKFDLLKHLKRRFANGETDYLTFKQSLSEIGWLLESIKILASLSFKVSLGNLLRDRQKYPYAQNYVFESIGRTLAGAGRAYSHYHRKIERGDSEEII